MEMKILSGHVICKMAHFNYRYWFREKHIRYYRNLLFHKPTLSQYTIINPEKINVPFFFSMSGAKTLSVKFKHAQTYIITINDNSNMGKNFKVLIKTLVNL